MDESDLNRQNLLSAYEFARENRNQADASAWEMTAIIWGAQTLLLGFVLEAIDQRRAQPLIVVVALLGIAMGFFSKRVMSIRRNVCNRMVEICRKVENDLPMQIKPQHLLDKTYDKEAQTKLFSFVNTALMIVWVVVAILAAYYFLKCKN